MKKGIHPELEKLTITYPGAITMEVMSSVGGKLMVEINKDDHPAWGKVKVMKTSNEITEKYNEWF